MLRAFADPWSRFGEAPALPAVRWPVTLARPAPQAAALERSPRESRVRRRLDEVDEAARKIADGDTAAFAVVVRLTSQPLFRLATRLIADEVEAEDVVQGALLVAFRELVEGRFETRSAVRTWLHRIVVNRALDVLRRRRVHVAAETAEEPRSTDSPEATVALRQLAELARRLPPEQHVVLVLRALEGFSTREVGELLELTDGAVEQRLVRARATLRRWVAP